MAKEAGSTTGLNKRTTQLAVGATAASAGAIGATALAPSVVHGIELATSTGPGIAATAGLGVGLAATGIVALATKSHWSRVSAGATTCGTVDPTKTIRRSDEYRSYEAQRCVHDGSVRQGTLRTLGTSASVVGLAAGLVGGLSAHFGIEHGLAAVIEDGGIGILAAGTTLGAWSMKRSHAPRGSAAALGE